MTNEKESIVENIDKDMEKKKKGSVSLVLWVAGGIIILGLLIWFFVEIIQYSNETETIDLEFVAVEDYYDNGKYAVYVSHEKESFYAIELTSYDYAQYKKGKPFEDMKAVVNVASSDLLGAEYLAALPGKEEKATIYEVNYYPEAEEGDRINKNYD